MFCCILLVGQLVNFYIQQSKTLNQHHLYTTFEQISSVNYFHLWPHVAPTRATNNKGRYLYLPSVSSRWCMHCYRFQQSGFNSTPVVLPFLTYRDWWNMRCVFPRARYQFWEEILSISRSVPGAWAYLTVWSTSRSLSFPASNILDKDINPKERRYPHLGESNQHNSPGRFEKPARPVFIFLKYSVR